MNTLDAWKALRQGKDVERPNQVRTALHWKTGTLKEFLNALHEEEILANDWEVVREKKTMAGIVTWAMQYGIHYPMGTEFGSNNLNFRNIQGKTTKITIEWEE
jgi:hypothetical protein